jgi:molybdopterin-containing oxidoreductase family membrane subunit
LTFVGSFGLFFTLFLLFLRFGPMIGMAEVKGVMPEAHHGRGAHGDYHGDVPTDRDGHIPVKAKREVVQ